MFGKVIQFKHHSGDIDRDKDPSSEAGNQSHMDIMTMGPDVDQSSRISHINFGSECYFGLVTDPLGKAFSVHVTFNPETKAPKKASCSCFRSSTRVYCDHIAFFVRHILRVDEETGRLHTLGDDFHGSFWYRMALLGYKIFGDSRLDFRAQVNHAGEGIRISFSDRAHQEILSFMPGPRLVEEFLFEFFDLIRRDMDPVLYRRMYGRKLKDPNVPSLRRKPWQMAEEDEDKVRGTKSVQQQIEESMWYRIAKVGFLISGRGGGNFRFRFMEHRNELTVEALDEQEEVIMRFTPPRAHIGTVIEIGERCDAIGSDLLIYPQPLKTGYHVALTECSDLRITPVVENPDPDAEPALAFLDRSSLDDRFFGSYYYFPDWGFFRITANVAGGLPPEYFSPQKNTLIPAEHVAPFLAEHAEALGGDGSVFMDEGLMHLRQLEQYTTAVVQHKEFSHEGLCVQVEYDFGDFRMSLAEILRARRDNRRFIARGDKWIDTRSPQFAWMEGIDPAALDGGDLLRIGRKDYLRLLALHHRLEKHYSSARLKSWFQSLEQFKPPSRLPSLRAMKGKLRQYQKNGYGWLWFLYENGFSGLLCDDMGLGKTHQIMALMTAVSARLAKRPRKLRFLVICPTTVLSHWKEKILEFAPDLNPHVYHGTDRSFDEAFREHTMIVTSYGIALRDIEMLAEFRFDLLVLDEVQTVKNKTTKTYAAVKALDAVCTIGLTGTPIENSVMDLKAMFDIILPGYLMSDAAFEDQFSRIIEGDNDEPAVEQLSRLIHPFTLRRTKGQVLKELPPKIEDIRHCRLSDDQVRMYRDVVEEQGQGLVLALRDPDQKVPYMHVFAVLNYLKQICDHPCLLVKESKDYRRYASGKWDLFVELLEESLGSGQKVVVFSQYVIMLELIESYLRERSIEFATIKGHTTKRGEHVKRFNTDPKCMVFSASLRASGLGIDLTGGSVVIHYDRWWNSAREEQATDRVHRIGQRRGVQVFKLITENTLEEKIDRIIARKRQLMESVVKPDDMSLLKHFSREDLIELMSF
ncbi:MAG: DEAD/DEAH box helicase [Thermodesulfobacteriota bacterium]